MLCILAPITLILLTSLSNLNVVSLSKNVSSSIGVFVMLFLISIAVGLFILNNYIMRDYEYLEKDYF